MVDKLGTLHGTEHFTSLYSMHWLLWLAWCEEGLSFRSSSRSMPTLLKKTENCKGLAADEARPSCASDHLNQTQYESGLAGNHPASPGIKRTSNRFMASEPLHSWASAQLVRRSTNSCSLLLFFPTRAGAWDPAIGALRKTTSTAQDRKPGGKATCHPCRTHWPNCSGNGGRGWGGSGWSRIPETEKTGPLSRCSPRLPGGRMQAYGAWGLHNLGGSV